MREIQFETTILGGLPVVVKAAIMSPDPEVGIFRSYLEEYELYWLKGGEVPRSIYDRITPAEFETLQEDALDAG